MLNQEIRLAAIVSGAAVLFSSPYCGAQTLPVSQKSSEPAWDSTAAVQWPPAFEKVEIRSTLDGAVQNAFFYKPAASEPRPLLVSLHTWSGDYTQRDGLAAWAQKQGWNYIHPDFRGPNKTPQACGSPAVIQDIDDAIAYARAHAPVDTRRIFVVGVSGGGYAACLNYLSTRQPVRATFAWVPITDLEAWYYQCRARKLGYADHVYTATGSSGGELNASEARQRSPLYLPLPKNKTAPLHLFAGIHDGYTGSVPISHTLLFYNRLAAASGIAGAAVPESDIIALLARGQSAAPGPGMEIGGRKVFYFKSTPLVSVTIFDGGHQMIESYCASRLEQLAAEGAR